MRVLIVHPKFYIYGGAELLIVRLANYLSARGIKNALLTTAMLPEVKKDLISTEIHLCRALSIRPRDFAESLSLYRGISNFLNEFDVINLHNYPAEISMLFRHKPNVWMCNEPAEVSLGAKEERRLIHRMVNRCFISFDKFAVRHYINSVVVADSFNADRFRRLYGIAPLIIPYGIDYDFFSQPEKSSILKDFGLSDNFAVLQVGNFTPFKNQIKSLETINDLKYAIPGIKLILAGWSDNAYAQEIKDYIKDNNLSSRVVITGHLDRQAIRKLYYAADLLLHPIKSQGGWLAPFEALCAQKPVIVSPQMSASDIIGSEGIGIVTDNYAEAILKIYNEPKKYCAMAERGKAWVKENLSWDKFCDKMTNLFYHVAAPFRK